MRQERIFGLVAMGTIQTNTDLIKLKPVPSVKWGSPLSKEAIAYAI
jgi:hypothetical protein